MRDAVDQVDPRDALKQIKAAETKAKKIIQEAREKESTKEQNAAIDEFEKLGTEERWARMKEIYSKTIIGLLCFL